MKARMLMLFSLGILLLLAAYIPMRMTAAAATAPCAVTYQVNQWYGGFTADVQVTNNGAALSDWTLTWTFSGNQQITSAWNTQATQNGAAVTARNMTYNGSLPTGGMVDFGFQATFSGSNASPTDFALNGTSCGGTPTATPTPNTPTATSTPLTPTPTMPPTPTPTATSTPPSGGGCSGAIFCDGFENQTGSLPSGTWQVSYPNCQGTGTVTVDRTVAHSGSTSIRVNGYTGYCNHVFFGTPLSFVSSGADLYVRYFIRHTTALPTGHVTSVAMRDANDGGNDLRMGGQNGALQWNRQSDDATLPAQSPAGVALSMQLPTNQWECVEFEVNQGQGTMRTWLNGNEVPGLHLDNVATQDVDAQWLQSRPNWRPALTDLRMGWESYSGGDDTLWFDDVAVGTQQIGCGS
ncbi:MAG TPA: cellulose-binding domain-containing protein [Ktedonobacteraceae bacterium]|nr:cellulose-binding domain-containing protein [Ktedonobacteraceae bacterium]